MIPLFLSSTFISKHLSIYSSESKEYKFSNELKVNSFIKEEFLLLLGFLFFFQTLYNSWNSFVNTLIFYIFIDFQSISNYDIVVFEIKKKDVDFFFTQKDMFIIMYIVLSFFISKLQLIEIFILLFFQKYSSLMINYIESNYFISLSEYYDKGIKKVLEIVKDVKEKKIDNVLFKKEE